MSYRLIRDQWFLIGVLAVSTIVMINPFGFVQAAGVQLTRLHASEIGIAVVFLCSGLELSWDHIREAIQDWRATALALVSLFITAPLLAWGLAQATPSLELRLGLCVIAVVPTTLVSGMVMSEAAGGRMAHALLITIVSNVLCIFTIPGQLALMIPGNHPAISLPYMEMMTKLALLIVAPLLVGMLLRGPLAPWLARPPFRPSMVSRCVMLTMIFLGFSKGRQSLVDGGWMVVLSAFGLAAALHLLLAAILWGALRGLRWEPGRRESVFFMGIQKTLPLCIWLQTTYFSAFGMVLVVCVFYHAIQLIVDSYWVGRLAASRQPRAA